MAAANEKQWREFWQRLGAIGNPVPRWQRLHTVYTESWRAYHNLDHIGHCLSEFESAKDLAQNHVAIEAAIWFHDAVYDTHKKDNEERSADLADEILQAADKPIEFRESVGSLIRATKHQAQPVFNDACLLTDIDLSILGQDPVRYAEFERQIRHEYSWVADKDFAAGRSVILKGFLHREHIFNTPTFAVKYDEKARVNLAWAINQLGA